MKRHEIKKIMSRVDDIFQDTNVLVPGNNFHSVKFRAELSGLLVVAISATYENCVKEILIHHATKRDEKFGQFVTGNFLKLNSRIRIQDLNNYCKNFNPGMNQNFKDLLLKRKQTYLKYTKINIENSYDQILQWRHDYAHALNLGTTIEEAFKTHKAARHVLFALADTFERHYS